MASSSRISGFYDHTITQRLKMLVDTGWLSPADFTALQAGELSLKQASADRMVENVIGTFSLPMGLALNFVIDDVERVVPLVVEEPSIVAALCAAAKAVRAGGGFVTESQESLLIGQIQVVDLPCAAQAQQALITHQARILNLANSLHPNMVARGGGAKELAVRPCVAPRTGADMLVVHLMVDTCDAMGANLVNTMCEGVAGLIEELTSGRVFLRILSNLTDRALVRARAVVPLCALNVKGYDPKAVRDGIIAASDLAAVDPYRAATHNKGIMNGIDAVALATGNDWRAIEAAAHAYAGRGEGYRPLTTWSSDLSGNLVGHIEIPLKVGTRGGNLDVNPSVGLAQRLLKVTHATELARIMASVGLAQNFAALKALATDGIQAGHMTLHARSVAASAGAEPEFFDELVEALISSGEIKLWKAQELLQDARARRAGPLTDAKPKTACHGAGYGKVLLCGEHAVVYGSHALAVPIPLAARAWVSPSAQPGAYLIIPAWGVEERLRNDGQGHSLARSLHLIWEKLGLGEQDVVVTVHAEVPRAMGLGSSAAMAVAIVRALGTYFKRELSDEQVSALAFEAEKVAHGTPSGVDNAIATVGRPILFARKDAEPVLTPVRIGGPVPLVVGMSRSESLTATTVRQVRERRERNPDLVNRLFAQIDALTLRAAKALGEHDLATLGELMDLNHGLLHALRVSSPQIEQLVHLARSNGALGAKVTGGGGGGSMVAVCKTAGDAQAIAEKMKELGFGALCTTLAANHAFMSVDDAGHSTSCKEVG